MTKRIKIFITVIALVGTILAGSFNSILDVWAAWLNQTTVTITEQRISQAANTTIRFRTPSGVGAPADTIVVTWPAGFDLSSIVLTDIDLSHGVASGYETEETLAAAAAAGVWGASFAGQVLTLTPPTDAAPGEIAANHYVVVEVGTHASTGGAGANQVTNPGTEGSYVFNFGGGFGDSNSAAVWISTDNTVGITGTVPTTAEICTNGIDDDGDGLIDCADPDCYGHPACAPPGGGDVTPPVISNIQVINITQTSAEVTWDTNEPATSCVEYGETSSYELGMECNMTLVYSHSIVLTGLDPLTTYHFRVISRDVSFNTAMSGDNTFTTLGDSEAPIISNIRVINITQTSAEVVWDTNEAATSQVDYGLTSLYGLESPLDMTYVTEHHVILTGLTPDTEYHFLVRSYDMSGNGAVSGDNTFRTLAPGGPIITGVMIVDITETSARVIWTTDIPADSVVDYGETIGYELGTLSDGTLVISHSIPLSGLTPNTLYHIRVHSTDGGLETVTGDYTFTTLPDTTPPANVTNFVAIPGPGELEITLTWDNPTDPDFAGVRICRSEAGYPVDPLTCTVIYEGTGESFVDTAVVAGVLYYYTNFAFDTYMNFASGAIASARIPVPIVFNIIAKPEKRWPRVGNWDTTAEFEIRNVGVRAPLETASVSIDDLGNASVTMTAGAPGTAYDFALKGFSHLRKRLDSIIMTESTNTVDFTLGDTFFLLAGDTHISKDNYVNSLDISTLLNDLMSPENVSDLNNDTQVNSLDITILLANLSVWGDE